MRTDAQVARAWMRIQTNWWAYKNVLDACQNKPRRAWRLLEALTKYATTAALITDLGAGPLEDFIRKHAPAFICQIERRCAENPRFKRALRKAWLPKATDSVSRRLFALGCKPIP